MKNHIKHTLWSQNLVVDGTIDLCSRGQNLVIGTIHGQPRLPIFSGPGTEHLSEYLGVLWGIFSNSAMIQFPTIHLTQKLVPESSAEASAKLMAKCLL